MKFFTLFAAGAAASSLVERDIGTVTSAIASIQSATTNLQSGINSFSGAGDVDSLRSASEAVISAITMANQQVGASDDLSGSDALMLPGPINRLSTLVQNTVNAAIAKKQTFVSAGVGGVVYNQLVTIRDDSNTFSDTLIGKVPMGLQQIGRNLAAPISQALDKGVMAFADQQGNNGGGSSSASGSSSSSAPSSSSSGAASSSSSSAAVTTTSSAVIAPYPTGSGSSSAAAGPTAVPPPVVSSPPAGSSSAPAPPSYTGAASHQVAGFGAVAMAAVAAVAAF